jgi:putative ABC transport system permease protein
VGQILEDIYGVAQRAEEIAANPYLLVTALALGVSASLIGAWIPARNAASVDPVKALQKGTVQVIGAGENRIRRWAALICGAVSATFVYTGQTVRPVFYAGYLLAIAGAVLLTPTVALALARVLRPVRARSLPTV